MVLLADGDAFVGAITSIPDAASDEEAVVAYAEAEPATIAPGESEREAFDRALANPHRRVVVLGDDGQLLGLVCLNRSRTGFCQSG